ncbi:tetratricopeptide repeat-containing sulfotransferase family protein [Kordiimonas aquimaris]|uniref:tetratricopeptide repeat-containing sulfotransferase family protein n=1 Tax=Kordiimonas aquimaris TaxID=707591 RepID=UPI0021CFEEA6|nr:tetratricopeptide repeat-containing sulfotransferase family protein [Kordiimonas aquimaris]
MQNDQRKNAELLQRGFAALQSGDLKTAESCCQKVLGNNAKIPQAHFLVGLIAIETKNRKLAASAFHTVTQLDPKNTAAWAHLAKVFSELGYTVRADDALKNAEKFSTDRPLIQNVIGSVWTLLGEHEKAHSWFLKAHMAEPKSSTYGVNRANAESFLGHTHDAMNTIEAVLEDHPSNPQAHWIRAGLSKATNSDHANTMSNIAAQQAKQPHAAAFLYYGAGKEYEDIEDWPRAFDAFNRGAAAKRKTINYDEAEEERIFGVLAKKCTQEWMQSNDSDIKSSAPIFIIGQPRTGTTLIERIITSHSDVASAGELQQFYLAIRRISNIATPARNTAALMESAVSIDPGKLGSAYVTGTRNHAQKAAHFVDKMPANYLYAPLIARALPQAKFIHVMRGPMDSCFASFKQLFADAYPHSYNLEEMARHHVRYRRIMDQWQDVLGEQMINISYEETVQNLEDTARRLISFLDLPWQDDCLNFHQQKSAVSTASAVQVREPAHTRSVGRWRHYESELQPMTKIIKAAGLPL